MVDTIAKNIVQSNHCSILKALLSMEESVLFKKLGTNKINVVSTATNYLNSHNTAIDLSFNRIHVYV